MRTVRLRNACLALAAALVFGALTGGAPDQPRRSMRRIESEGFFARAAGSAESPAMTVGRVTVEDLAARLQAPRDCTEPFVDSPPLETPRPTQC